MEKFINDLIDYCKDNDIGIEFGVYEKYRRKAITEALGKLSEDKETKKLEIAKKLVYNYLAVDHLMNNIKDIPYFQEFSRYGPRLVAEYMEKTLDSFKICLIAVIVAMSKDEELKKFYKELMRRGDEEA